MCGPKISSKQRVSPCEITPFNIPINWVGNSGDTHLYLVIAIF